jgi:hypothetical protein
MMFVRLRWLFPGFLVLTLAGVVAAQAAGGSPPADTSSILARAREVTGFARVGQMTVHYHSIAAVEQNYQSDRTYPPFFSAMQVREAWFDPASGVERLSTETTFPGNGPGPAQLTLTDAKRAFGIARDTVVPLPRGSMQSRYLNPWLVIADWTAAGDARPAATAQFRDYPRSVLSRVGGEGEQRLFLDPKTGFPVKLEVTEKHYLWGQRRIEYLYTNWTRMGAVMFPGSSFRLADGKTEASQTVGSLELIAHDAGPPLSLPVEPVASPDALPRFLQPLDLKIEQVGPKTYLLSNPGYTEAVTEVGNEIFIFDATQGEERARKDADAIAKLFPGEHKLTVVVTDLAWPHVAGVRYWVARGATIFAHRGARAFLEELVNRRWTLAPDLLEQQRKSAKLKFVSVDQKLNLAGEAISLHAIDGIGSEVALMAYLSGDQFLWASDYIQTLDEPTSYASEVWRAVNRDGLKPVKVAAEHLPLTPWTKIEELQR